MFDLGAGELVLIVFVVLILFGPKKLPELAQSLGRGMREFKRAQREFTEQINQAVNDDHYKKQRGPELERPEGSVSRSGSRRLSPTDDASETPRTDRTDGASEPATSDPIREVSAPEHTAPASATPDAPPTASNAGATSAGATSVPPSAAPPESKL